MMIFPEKHPDNCSNLRKKSRVKSKQKKKEKKRGARRRKSPIQPSADDSAPWKYICMYKIKIIKERERFGLTGEKGFGICKI